MFSTKQLSSKQTLKLLNNNYRNSHEEVSFTHQLQNGDFPALIYSLTYTQIYIYLNIIHGISYSRSQHVIVHANKFFSVSAKDGN
jgi:hypothetical protein